MNLFLKILVTTLVFFIPFSFAATEPWAFTVVQGLLMVAWIAILFSRRQIFYPSFFCSVVGVFGILIGLAGVQCLFPQTLLDTVPAYPITLMRLYTLDHLCLFATYFATVLLIVQIYPSLDEVKQLVWTLVLAAGAVEICELLLPNGEYISFLTGIPANPASVGPFVNRDHAGVFLAMNSLLALGLFFTHSLKYRKIITRKQKYALTVQQICLALLSLGLMIAAVFTRSRGAMLSLLVGLFGYAFLCAWSIPSQMRRRLKGFFYTLILLILSAAWVYTHVEDINEFAQRKSNASAETRAMMYRSAEELLKKYPVWGIGIGAMPVAINQYTEFDVHQYIEHLHNDWLEITLGIGYGGAALLALALGWFIIGALKRLKRLELRKQFLFAALLATLLAMSTGSLVDFHFFIPGCAWVFFCVLGLVNAPTFHKGHVHSLHTPVPLSLVLIALLVSTGYLPLQKTRSWRAFVFGQGLKTEGKLAAYQTGLSFYPAPRQATRLAAAYYAAASHSQDPIVQLYYFEQALQTAQTYLEKYPKEKELSRLYIYSRRKLQYPEPH